MIEPTIDTYESDDGLTMIVVNGPIATLYTRATTDDEWLPTTQTTRTDNPND